MSQVLFLRSDRKLPRFVGSPRGVRSVYLNLHETEFYQLPSSQDLFKTQAEVILYFLKAAVLYRTGFHVELMIA